MTVKELIAQLEKENPEAIVVTAEDFYGKPVYWEITSTEDLTCNYRLKSTWYLKEKAAKAVLIG